MGYYDSDADKITVTGRGTAETRFTSASFTVSIYKQAATGPAAKAEAEETISQVKQAIAKHAKSADIDTSRIKTTFVVETHHNRNTGGFDGYQAIWTCSFSCRNVGEATNVHDSLTSIEGVQAKTPTFHVDDSADVYAKSFAEAVRHARTRFTLQCEALGFKPEDFDMLSWHIRDDRPHGKVLALSENTDEIVPSIEPGKATLELSVNFVYAPRKPLRHDQ